MLQILVMITWFQQPMLASPVPLHGSGPDSANSNRVTLACLKLRLPSMFMSPCYALGMTQTWIGALISNFLSSAEMNWSTISIIAWIETEWHQLMSLFLYEMWFSQQAWTPHSCSWAPPGHWEIKVWSKQTKSWMECLQIGLRESPKREELATKLLPKPMLSQLLPDQ